MRRRAGTNPNRQSPTTSQKLSRNFGQVNAESVESGPLVKEHLAVRLKDAIIEGRLSPGQRVVEGAWGRKFGVAQASVREAINLLIAEGFLVKSAGRSARVLRYTQKDIAHIYAVRGSLEGLAAQLATAAQADVAPLEAALDRMQSASERGDLKEMIESDLAFHLALAEASGNPLLTGILNRLLRPLFAFVLLRVIEMHGNTTSWGGDLPRHREIVYLVREGNPAVAGQFVQHCIGRFVASAHAVWAPEAHARRLRKS
jgi:DNA-binding GntR family transcriptional regulator